MGGITAANCAALGMPSMGEQASACSAADRKKKQSNVGEGCEKQQVGVGPG